MDFDKLPRFKSFTFQITIQIPIWADAFQVEPQEIERQIAISHTWIDANPRKAPKNVMRFLQNWMAIADRKHSLRRSARPVTPREPDPEPDMTFEEMVAIRKKNFGEIR